MLRPDFFLLRSTLFAKECPTSPPVNLEITMDEYGQEEAMLNQNFCENERTVVVSVRSNWKRSAETDRGSMFPVFHATAICLAMERLTNTKAKIRSFNCKIVLLTQNWLLQLKELTQTQYLAIKTII